MTLLHFISGSRRTPHGRRHPIDRIGFILLLASVALAPYVYGGITPQGKLLIEGLGFLACAFALATPQNGPRRAIAIPLIALIGLVVLGAIQWLPLGARAASLSPASGAIYSAANATLQLFDAPRVAARISIAPSETAAAALLIAAFAALAIAAAILVDDRRRRTILFATLVATSIVHVGFAAIIGGEEGRIHGAFINPNHLAGYLQISVALALGAVWSEILISRDRAAGIGERAERIEKRALPLAGFAILWLILAAGIVLTRSRGGITAAAITTIVLLALTAMHPTHGVRKRRASVRTAMAIGGTAAVVAMIVGAEPLLRFLSSDPREIGSDSRVTLWASSVDAWQSFPIFGSGLGTFREAFRGVQPAELHGLVEQAHNDFLQMLVTGGAIGALLSVVAIGSAMVIIARKWTRQQHRAEAGFLLGTLGALIALVLHGIVEFNFSLPAIPATLAVVVGAAFRVEE